MKAAELLRQGVSQSEVARRMGVHRQSVIRWARQLAQSGRAGLKKAGRAGRKPRLSAAQLKQIEQALKRGPETLGYASGLWTAGRVRELIEHQCGVRYHEAHVWRILRRLGWSGPESWPPFVRRQKLPQRHAYVNYKLDNVDEDDGAPLAERFFLSCGQRTRFQYRMAFSSRSSARPVGRWQLQPSRRMMRQTWAW